MPFQFILNISLLFGLLIAPTILFNSIWYRRSLGKAVFTWNKPEMVVLTIIFFVLALILLIIGISCMFSYWGYIDSIRIKGFDENRFLKLGIGCFISICGLAMTHIAFRKLLVQLIMENGIVLNRALFPLSSRLDVLEWKDISDYYVVPDYPNAIFNFITKADEVKYSKHSVKVPIYLKDNFQEFLDEKLLHEGEERSSTQISNPYFSEN